MKASGPRNERETIILFNEEDEYASLWTASEPVYRGLMKRLGSEYLIEDGERHASFSFPRKWLNLPRVKAKRVLTPHQRLLAAQRLARKPEIQGAPAQEAPILEGPEDG